MNKITLVIIAFVYCQISFSQTDSAFIEKLNQPIENCETIATNSQKLISKYSISQKELIKQVLRVWEVACGSTEPIRRVKILLDISENSFSDTAYTSYFNNHIFDYFDRINAAYKEDFKEIYELNKEYFNYVQLRSEFDDWTYNIAQQLKKEQRNGTSAYLMCVLFSEDIKTFDNEISSSAYQKSHIRKTMDDAVYNSSQDNASFVARVGVWMPIGKLGWRFSMSPLIGIGGHFPITKKYSIEMGANFTFWNNNKDIVVYLEDSFQNIKSKYGGTYGLWLHREHSFNNQYFVDGVVGIAYSNMGTGVEKSKTDEEEATAYYHIGTVDLSIGLNVRKRVFKRHNTGINLVYHFRPYNIDKRLETKLGQHSFSISLFYRF